MLNFICLNLIKYWYFYLIIFMNLFYSSNCRASIRQLEKRILDNILGKDYDNRIRPSGANSTNVHNDGACIVTVNIFVRSISRIDDVTMEYATQITFREEWSDDRLKYNNISGIRFLTLTEPEKIWKPDLFFSNEKEGHFHNIIMPNVLLRIYPDGKVLYSIRISLVLFCPMHLKYFPLDMQTCRIQMASYGYTTEDLIFLWKKNSPVQITRPLNLPRFKLIKSKTNYCTSRTNTGEYSCIHVDLIFKREFSYYLILIYVPCCMLVIVSWVSFWIDPNSTAARVLLGVTSLLTMSRQNSGINASLPPVSYTKAVDVWTGSCLTFVFSALIEFAVVNYVSRQDAHRKVRRRLHAIKQNNLNDSSNLESSERNLDGNNGNDFHLGNHGNLGSTSNQTNRHRKRTSVRSYSRKKLESGKDSGIESDDLEEVIATRYVKSLGATKLSNKNVQDKNCTNQRDLLGSFSQDAPLMPGLCVPPLSQYASTTSNTTGNQNQVLLTRGQTVFNSTTNRPMLNYGNSGTVQPVFRGSTSAANCSVSMQDLSSSLTDPLYNPNTNFVNLVVNSQQKTNAIKAKRSHNFFINWLNRFPTRSKRIDVLSRICFPLFFALFNVFYWITYLLRDELINS